MENKSSTGLIIKIAVAVVVLAAASASFIIFRDTILDFLKEAKDKVFGNKALVEDDFSDFADE